MAPDKMAMEAEVALREPVMAPAPPEPDPDLIEQAAALLGEARNPIIAVGGGVFGAEEELLRVAEMLQAPVTMSRNAKGAVSFRHYLGLPETAGHRIWPQADVILAVGTRLYEQYQRWGMSDEARLIRIDIDPSEIDRNGSPAVGILADARSALAVLAERLGRHNRPRASRKDELEGLKPVWRRSTRRYRLRSTTSERSAPSSPTTASWSASRPSSRTPRAWPCPSTGRGRSSLPGIRGLSATGFRPPSRQGRPPGQAGDIDNRDGGFLFAARARHRRAVRDSDGDADLQQFRLRKRQTGTDREIRRARDRK